MKKEIKGLNVSVFLRPEIKTAAFRSSLCQLCSSHPHFGSFLSTTYKQIAPVFSNCCVYLVVLGAQQYFSLCWIHITRGLGAVV